MSAAQKVRDQLNTPGILTVPSCFDAISARLIERHGFPMAFMSGFATAGANFGVPDLGLLSYGEILDQGRLMTHAVSIPIIGDGDTGYGNALNVKRTVNGFADAGFGCVLIEDQAWPKRCGHTAGKQTVDFDEAVTRVKAAVDAREEGADILILARTDTRATHGLEEAIRRANAFRDAGADILFVEAPKSEAEMRQICNQAPGVHLANLVEDGDTPMLSPEQLQEIGYKLAIYPLTLFSASLQAMSNVLSDLKATQQHSQDLMRFSTVQDLVGFKDYYDAAKRYE